MSYHDAIWNRIPRDGGCCVWTALPIRPVSVRSRSAYRLTALTAAYDELAALARQRDVTEAIRLGPLVQHDHELIVTFWRDPSNGSGWAVGAGGIVTEEHNDLAVGRPPRNVDDARPGYCTRPAPANVFSRT